MAMANPKNEGTEDDKDIKQDSHHETTQDKSRQVGHGRETERDSPRQTAQDKPGRTGCSDGHSEVENKQSQQNKKPLPESRWVEQIEGASNYRDQVQAKKATKRQAKVASNTRVANESKPKHLEGAIGAIEKIPQLESNVDGVEYSAGDTIPQPDSQPQQAPKGQLPSKELSRAQSPQPLVDPEGQAKREALYPVVRRRASSAPINPTAELNRISRPKWVTPPPVKNVDKEKDAAPAPPVSVTEPSRATNSQTKPSSAQNQQSQRRNESLVPVAQAQAGPSQASQPPPPQRSDIAEGNYRAPWNLETPQVYRSAPHLGPNMTGYNGAQ
ncbi:hypothetical protein F5Y13DRAFT_168826 [Hypoxylon sp. FL1857]|nr:hypothetical protein F5Y13DRAFT_168826 [Hypoxylon sp. FL1857]